MKEKVYYDESGNRYVLDERGNKRPPMTSVVISKSGEFTVFDSSQGHCSLCGSLTCRGTCFK